MSPETVRLNPHEPALPAQSLELPSETIGDASDSAETSPMAPRGHRGVASSRLSLILVAILAGSALFVGGFSLGSHVATTPGTPASEETRFGPFWDVYSFITSKYAGSPAPDQDRLTQAAINGMMQSLNDPYSYYQAPADFQNSLLNVGGQAEGIGVQVKLQPVDPASTTACTKVGNGCELAVDHPIPGSPAEAAGIASGDVIVSVNGTSLDGMTIDQTTALIKGPKDTTVTLGLDRNGKQLQLAIVRKIYSRPEVATRALANGSVAYIAVSGMNPPASSQFDVALQKALDAGQRNVILDLRGNLGGYVADAVKIASEFIPSGTIAYQVDSTGTTSEVTATSGGRATDGSVHVVVLVDGNTASSAEILAGALQARGTAKLVGTKTFGKGIVQEWLPLSNNFGGIHLTVARWLTPDKVWIQGKGLQPDVPVTPDGARAGVDPVLDAGLHQLGFPPDSTASASPGPSGSPRPGLLPTGSPVPSGS
jgi:carboxyl-terminal processing protease